MSQATAPAPNLIFALNTETINLNTPNTLILTLTNTSGASLALAGGTPVSEDALTGSGPSTAYFNLGSLISHDEFSALTITTADVVWQATFWGDSHPAVWGLCPSQNITLGNGNSVTFSITLTPKEDKAGPGTFSVDYFNFPPNSSAGTANATLPVSLINAPTYSAGLDLGVEFLGNNVVRGIDALVLASGDASAPLQNTLTLQMVNAASTALVPTGQWGNTAPQFLLSFVSADQAPGYGALAPADMIANQFNASVGDTANWTIAKNVQTAIPSWTLYPTAQNKQILGPGAGVTVTFTDVETPFPIPQTTGYDVTNLRVQSVGIPNTNDTVVTVPIYKALSPRIDYIICDPANPTTTQPDTTLTWATENAAHIQFVLPAGSKTIANPSPSGSAATTLSHGQTLTMTAFNVVDSSSAAGAAAATYDTSTLTNFTPVSGNFDPSVWVTDQATLYLFGKYNNALTFANPVASVASLSAGNNFTRCYAAALGMLYGTQKVIYSVCSYGNDLYFCSNAPGASIQPYILITSSFSGGTCGLSVSSGSSPYPAYVSVTPTGGSTTIYYTDPIMGCVAASGSLSGVNFGPSALIGYLPNTSYAIVASPGVVGNTAYPAGVAVLDYWVTKPISQYVMPAGSGLLCPFVVSPDRLTIYCVDTDGPVVFTIDPNNGYAISLSRPFVRPIGKNPWVSLSGDGRFLYILDADALTVHDTRPVAVAGGESTYLSTHINFPIQGAAGAIFPHPQDASVLYYLYSNSDIHDCSTMEPFQLEPWPFPSGATAAVRLSVRDATPVKNSESIVKA